MGTRVWIAVIAVVVLGACSSHGRATAPTSTVAPGPDPHGAAAATAADLVHRVELPPGATAYTGTLPALLREPFESENTPNLVDEPRAWIVAEPSAQVLAFMRAHPPRGLAVAACCGSSGSPNARADTVTFAATNAYSGSGPVASSQLLVSVSARTASTTWVRADAQAVWRPARDPATIVAAADRIITVGHSVIDDPTTVAQLERTFNALPAAVPSVSNGMCNQAPITVEFRRSVEAAPDVSVSALCGDLTVTARGHRQALETRTFVADALKATSK